MKKTLVLGATPNPARYAYAAVEQLLQHGHEVVPVGIRNGQIAGLDIHTDLPDEPGVDTVTLYVGAERQPPYYPYLLSLKPTRIIFNPGTENPELERLAQGAGIHTERACTLVLLSLGSY